MSKYEFNQIKRRVESDKGIGTSICGPENRKLKAEQTHEH